MNPEQLTPERHVLQEVKPGTPKLVRLTINDFAREIGLQPDEQGRFTFGPEHIRLAYEYGEKFARDHKAESIIIDGIASPGVIAALLHGVHPAEGYLAYQYKDPEGNTVKSDVKILEPIPQGDGQGPKGFTWSKKETPEYTLVEFALAGNFAVEDLDKVIPPEVDPTKPVIISGRGPLFLTHTIAAAYRHYKGLPGIGFYQPASKFGPAKTEIGISHDEKLPLGLNFGEPAEIGLAKKRYEERIGERLSRIQEAINNQEIASVEVNDRTLTITLKNGEVYNISVIEVSKSE